MATFEKVEFSGAQGDLLSARLERPYGPVRAYAIFAHCFSCSKDIHAASRIARKLARHGIAVLRFDFTGLGQSEGEFANTNFSSNIADLVKAAEFLEQEYDAPSLLIGHSLGGAAVIAAAHEIPSTKAIVTIGAPADAEHVSHQFAEHLEDIEQDGEADVLLGGRPFKIKKQFLDDIAGTSLEDAIATLKKPVLICHSPIDQTVGIENAGRLFLAAKHPKSFVSLDDADHLLSRDDDARHVADIVSAWADRYAAPSALPSPPKPVVDGVVVEETGCGKFQNWVVNQHHAVLADEPESVGGLNSGMTPYGYIAAGLGACTSMTLRMYADFKKLPLEKVRCTVRHNKDHAHDCEGCEDSPRKVDIFEREIEISGNLSDEQRTKLLEIADKCPVHKTLHDEVVIRTQMAD